jgi:hypothetical protein
MEMSRGWKNLLRKVTNCGKWTRRIENPPQAASLPHMEMSRGRKNLRPIANRPQTASLPYTECDFSLQ